MYIKNFRGKSKLSELKNRKKAERKVSKSITATTDTRICENCKILQEMNYCKVLFESIKIQYQFLDEYLQFRRSGLESKRDLNDIWAEVRHSENSLKADRVLKQCPLLRKKFKSATYINKSDMMYMLDIFCDYNFFLCRDKIYVAKNYVEWENDSPIIETIKLTELYEVTLFKDYPKTSNDIDIKTIIKNETESDLTPEQFLEWIDEPCDINKNIDLPFYEIIKYLKIYNKCTFKNNRYIFYSKQNDEVCFDYEYFYAYDTKNKTELKLYCKAGIIRNNEGPDNWQTIPPKELKDVIIHDKKMSVYQKRQYKRAFLEYINQNNEYFNVENYWVMELIWLAIQPILILREWSSCIVFPRRDKDNEQGKFLNNIYVYDFPKRNEEPSFYITQNGRYGFEATKIATLRFKEPKYHFKDIYKRNYAKRKCWKLSKEEIEKLMYFLNSKPDRELSEEYGIKTNWQALIYRYNENTATGNELEKLPLDLPMPNYLEL